MFIDEVSRNAHSSERVFPFFRDGHFPWDADAPDDLRQGLLDVERQATAFERQCHELTELHKDSRPFRLRDTNDDSQRYRKVRLRHGDLVHFRLKSSATNEDGEALAANDMPVDVESLAISAIWRENAQDVFTFLRDAEDHEQRPMAASRYTITMAEAMFGFVDAPETEYQEVSDDSEEVRDAELERENSKGLNTLAGRIRFSAALLSPEHSNVNNPRNYDAGQSLLSLQEIDHLVDVEVEGTTRRLFPLRILSSPKLPCPEMYFEFASETPVGDMRRTLRAQGAQQAEYHRATPEERTQRSLQPPENLPRPRGFKWYVHDLSAATPVGPHARQRYAWQTSDTHKHQRQKALVHPLKPGQTFFFTSISST